MKPSARARDKRMRIRARVRPRPHSRSHALPTVLELQPVCTAFNKPAMPQSGHIRFLAICKDPSIPEWIHDIAYTSDRSYTQWMSLIDEYKIVLVPGQINMANPFLCRPIIGHYLEALYERQMARRWIIRKFIMCVRLRCMARRTVGLNDLYTTVDTPVSSQVIVYDYKSRSRYIFHTHTAMRIILSGLKYSQYGISQPTLPKNPYTNLKWTLGQTMAITSQIVTNLIRVHRIPPAYIHSYRQCGYNLQSFSSENKIPLAVDAAQALFKDESDEVGREIYMEMIDDLYKNDDIDKDGWRFVRRCIRMGKLPAALLQRWNVLVISAWIYENNNYMHNFATVREMHQELQDLHYASIDWWRALPRPVRPARRAQPVLGASAMALTSAASINAAADVIIMALVVASVEAAAATAPDGPPSDDTQVGALSLLLSMLHI
jgi:hypothetical protein